MFHSTAKNSVPSQTKKLGRRIVVKGFWFYGFHTSVEAQRGMVELKSKQKGGAGFTVAALPASNGTAKITQLKTEAGVLETCN